MEASLPVKFKWPFCGSIVALLMAGASSMALSGDSPADNLSPNDILKKAQETYDSLTSYSDRGKSVCTYKDVFERGAETMIITFTTKLARPNLYRIKWEVTSDLSQGGTKIGGVLWSAGKDTFWDVGSGPERQETLDKALMRQASDSGMATETIPGVFFKVHWRNVLGDLGQNGKREVDEKVGDINCYVFSKEYGNGVKSTLWIGKQDFLIHQLRTVSNLADDLKTDPDSDAKRNPDSQAPLPKTEPTTTLIETHSDIVVNQKFLPADFTR